MASTIATSSKIGVASNWGAIADVSTPGVGGDPGYVLVLGDDAKLHVYKSTDGTTWTEQDSADAPTVHDATYPYSGHRSGSFIYTIRFTAANTVRVRRFDCSSDQWETTDTPASDASTAANNTRSVRVVIHSDGDIVIGHKDSGNADAVYRVYNGSSWGTLTTITGADGHPLDFVLMQSGYVLQYFQDVAGDDATYRTLSSGSAQGTATDFDVSVNTGELKSSRVTLFNDGTNNRVFAVNCDTGNEVDGYHANEGTTALGSHTAINAISDTSAVDLTSVGTAVFNSKLWVCYANTTHDIFYDSSTSLTTLTFGTDVAGNLYSAAPMPQFIMMGDGLGILAQNGTSVEVEWITAPTTTTPKSAPDSQGIISSEGSSLIAAIPKADSQAFGSAEVSRIAFATTDSQAFGSAEVARISVIGTDSQAIGSVESSSMSAAIPQVDNQAIGSAESPTLAVTLPQADSQALGSAEDPDVSFGNTPVSAPDSQAFGSAETARIALTKADSQAIISAEISSLVALMAQGDSQAIGSAESARPGPKYIDANAIGSVEAFRVGIAMNDSQAFGSTEGLALDASIVVADSQAIESSTSPSLNLIQKSANDNQALGSAEASQLVIAKGDSQEFGSVESASLAVQVSVADTIIFISSEFAYEGDLPSPGDDGYPFWKYLIP